MQQRVRIIITKRGYEHLMKSLKKYESEEVIKAIINNNTCEFYGNIVFLKWDNPKHFKLIKSIITIVMGYSNTYRAIVVDGNRVQTYSDMFNCEYIDLPMPVMNCEFYDEVTVKKIKKLNKGGIKDGI